MALRARRRPGGSATAALLLGVVLLTGTGLAVAETARYRLTVDNTWSEETHPRNLPPAAHFSWLGGGTHSAAVAFWNVGVVASPGTRQMAETGVTDMLVAEVGAAIGAGTASGVLSWQHWFCPATTTLPPCGPLQVEFDIEDSHPLVTLATMLGPSPDWFVGVSGLPLREGEVWLESVVVELYPYDGGSRSANVWELFGPLTIPADPVTLITAESGQLVGPGSLGRFTFERITTPDADGDSVLDDLDNCPQFPNPDQGPAVFGYPVVALDRETFSWGLAVDAEYVRGDLDGVDVLFTSEVGSLSDAASWSDPSIPVPGAGFYYLFRPGGTCADPSWQSSPGGEPARDERLP